MSDHPCRARRSAHTTGGLIGVGGAGGSPHRGSRRGALRPLAGAAHRAGRHLGGARRRAPDDPVAAHAPAAPPPAAGDLVRAAARGAAGRLRRRRDPRRRADDAGHGPAAPQAPGLAARRRGVRPAGRLARRRPARRSSRPSWSSLLLVGLLLTRREFTALPDPVAAAGRGAGRRPDAPRRLRRRRAAAAGAAVAARGPAVDGGDPGAVGALAGRGQRARCSSGSTWFDDLTAGPRPDVRHRRARARRLLPAALRRAPARADRRRRRAHPGAARAPRPRRLAGLLRAAPRQGGGVLAVGQGGGGLPRRGRGRAGLRRPAR